MNPRYYTIENIGKQQPKVSSIASVHSLTEKFGSLVFSKKVMEKMLPKEIFNNISRAMEGKENIRIEFADSIAIAMKEWAINAGATHYCHWFQPLTGATAEKHDSFIEWKSSDSIIEQFSGKQLIQGEPDASSFPSGGLRSTFEARGYTGWDPSSPAFIWKGGDGCTLFIPSIFYSWTGDVLDSKIPLLRSDKKLNDAALRLLHLTNTAAQSCYSTLGVEQEYFIIDRSLRNLRPDLLLLGRTVYGALPPKGQELEDHYLGAIKDRILAYMQDFEEAAIELGIPVKTRHNEVAPAQHEVAPVFEKASLAVDHNILTMELMRQIAQKHGLACLLHEKPFQGINGSGKHNNWSIATDTGLNLLDPTDTPESSLNFLILLTAILHGVYQHAGLLRATVGSASNDFRLGANEAPPAIISVYLGEALEQLLNDIETKGYHQSAERSKFNIGIPTIPELPKDNTDRNRTSPFAFTGNKFEYRAVGSSSSCALPITILNIIVAESLHLILDEIDEKLEEGISPNQEELAFAALPVIRKYLKISKNIRYTGDNYSEEWHKEADARGLPHYKQSIYAFETFKSPQSFSLLQGIFTEKELRSRYEILVENYSKTVNIQTKLMLDLFSSHLLPVCIEYQSLLAKALRDLKEAGLPSSPFQMELLVKVNAQIDQALELHSKLLQTQKKALELHGEMQAKAFCEEVMPVSQELRRCVDCLESVVDDRLWPLPKYRELLFII